MKPDPRPYDLAIWHEPEPISAADARRAYMALADESVVATEPAPVKAFAEQLLACFPGAEADALEPAPGSRNAHIGAIHGDCYIYEAGVYLSVPEPLAPDLIPVVCHLADGHGLVVYDRQRQGVFLPSAMKPQWSVRVTAGDGFIVAHDPTSAEIPALLDAAEQSAWFRIIERDAEHYLQTAPAEPEPGVQVQGGPGPGGSRPISWIVEYRDGGPDRHFQASGATLDQVTRAFVLFAVGGRFPDLFSWSPLA